MTDTDVTRLYDANAEDEWSRLGVRRTEFGVTCMALDEHLPPSPAKIIDRATRNGNAGAARPLPPGLVRPRKFFSHGRA